MNIIELKNRVDVLYSQIMEYNREFTKVGIEVKRIGSVGGTPIVDIKSINSGFDWDSGKIIITPETTLREIDRDEIKAIQDKYDELGWKKYQIDGLKRDIKKLKERIQELEDES